MFGADFLVLGLSYLAGIATVGLGAIIQQVRAGEYKGRSPLNLLRRTRSTKGIENG